MLPGSLRRIVRDAGAALVSPLAGAAYVVTLTYAFGLRAPGLDEPESLAAADAVIARRYAEGVSRVELGVVATAIALGLVLGLVADALVWLRRAALAQRTRRAALEGRTAARALLEPLLFVAALHASLVCLAMAETPQRYASRWYARGGLARTVQVIATDLLGPGGVVLVSVALAVLYVGPAPLGRLTRRGFASAWRVVVVRFRAGAQRSGALLAAVTLVAVALAVGAPRPRWARAARGEAQASGRPGATSSAPGARPERPSPAASASASGDERSSPAASASASGDERSSPAASASASGDERPNVLVVAAGSLRADRLDARVAPNLARLAARATRFDRAYVSMPSSSPSWVTLLSGRHAHHHGVRSELPTRDEGARALDALPARFAARGYATGALSDRAVGAFERVDLGFAGVDSPALDVRRRSRHATAERAALLLPVLDSRVGRRLSPDMRAVATAGDPALLAGDVEAALRAMRDRPFFLTAFFSTAAAPSAAPAPYYAKFTDRSYRGRFKYGAPTAIASAAAAGVDAADVRQIQGLYDGAVSAVDAAIGRVLAALERLDLAERTIVVVTADRGETLFEGGRGYGGGPLFGDEATHVPLVIYDPRVARDAAAGRSVTRGAAGAPAGGHREGAIVRDVDLAPTLYELAGIAPPADLDGRSLAPALRGAPLSTRFAYAETDLWLVEDVAGLPAHLRMPYPGLAGLTELGGRDDAALVLRDELRAVTRTARHRMVRDARWKLVYAPTRGGVRYLLFDTEADPGERVDVAAAHPDEVARLRAALWSWMLEDRAMEQRDGYLVPVRLLEDASGACSLAGGVACSPARAGEAFEVSARLVEIAGAARVRVSMPDGRASGEDPRSVDLRDALRSPAPEAISLRVKVPRGGRLAFAEAVANVSDETTVFVVEIVDALGARHTVYRHVVTPAAARRWSDATCDLSAFSGQDVELRLSTEVISPRGRAAPGAREVDVSRGRGGAGPPAGLWGTPTLYARTTPRLPYNVLWIVADALRPDRVPPSRGEPGVPPSRGEPGVPPSRGEPGVPPSRGEPGVPPSRGEPGVPPSLEELARRGARFTRVYSAGAWTRPAAVAMLTGARERDLGVDVAAGSLGLAPAARSDRSDAPLLPLALGRHNATTRAFVSDVDVANDRLAGAGAGFERVDRRRDDARATTEEAARWIRENKDTRFFALVSYDAARGPSTSPEERAGGAGSAGPSAPPLRLPVAPAADDAVGVLVRALDEAGLRERTIVVVSALHGVTTSPTQARAAPLRARAGFEEATRVPLVVVAPGAIAPGIVVDARVRSTDIAPTILDLLGVEPHARTSGQSLLSLTRGQIEGHERVVVSEGRDSRAILHGRWRLVVGDDRARAVTDPAKVTLFDVEADPGERRDLSATHPEIVAEMKARLEAALENVAVAGAPGAAGPAPSTLRLRFAGGASSRRISGTIAIGDDTTKPKSVDVQPVELGRDAFRVEGRKIDVAFRTSPSAPVGFDLVVDPPSAPVRWELWLDDRPWPADAVFGGPFGLPAPLLSAGVATDEARFAARAVGLPVIAPRSDVGIFVTRGRQLDRASERSTGDAAGTSGEAAGTSGDAGGTSGDAAGTSGEAAGTSGDAAGTSGDAEAMARALRVWDRARTSGTRAW
ncbi:MAG: sulfatase-like hydrolase/transferase [Labilithrix sp.]|nr:sulfatase-like hydrolase/transferase [Labilithrix sp.]